MHLFISDLFISIDTLAPVINFLRDKKKRVIILNINPVENFQEDKLCLYLKRRGVYFYDFLPINFLEKIKLLLISLLKFLPTIILKKIDFAWRYFYKFSKFSSISKIEKFLINNKVSSITYEETAEPRRLEIIFKAAKKLKIPIIQFPAGIHTLKVHKLGKNELADCDYYIAPNRIRKFNYKYKNKIFTYGSPRYSEKWIKKLNKIYNPIKKYKNKINIYLIKRNKYYESKLINQLEKNLKKNKNLHVISNNKPRDYLPSKCNDFYKNFRTTQLIEWCDFVLTSRSSSVLLEGIKKQKKILLLRYIYPKVSESLLTKFKKNVNLIENEKQLTKIISHKSFVKSTTEKKEFLKKFLIQDNKKNLNNLILKIYQNIENYGIK